MLPFRDLPIPLLALALYTIGFVTAFTKRASDRYIALVSLFIGLLFMYVFKRYAAFRYIMLFVPMFLLIAAEPLYLYLKSGANKIIQSKLLQPWAISAAFILLFVPFSWPGIDNGIFFSKAQADQTNLNGVGADYKTVYQYIRENRKKNEAVVTVLFRSGYWGPDEIEPVALELEKSLSTADFIYSIKKQKRGWIVFADGKAHHLRDRIHTFMQNNMRNVTSEVDVLQGTNMSVYYFCWNRKAKAYCHEKRSF
jgi:hypothetical protein